MPPFVGKRTPPLPLFHNLHVIISLKLPLALNRPFRLLAYYKLYHDGLLALATHQIRLSKQHLSESVAHPAKLKMDAVLFYFIF